MSLLHPALPLSTYGLTRHDWTREEVRAVFALPFPELIFRAAQVHREHFDATEVQISTLLSIKTGGCPEDCAYCPQSAKFDTGIKAEKLMDLDAVLAEARAAKASGAARFCMGAAWRSPKDRDLDKVCEMVEGVKALGMETCVTLGMLSSDQARRLKNPASTFTITIWIPRPNITARSSRRAFIRIVSTRWSTCARPASMSAVAELSVWVSALKTA